MSDRPDGISEEPPAFSSFVSADDSVEFERERFWERVTGAISRNLFIVIGLALILSVVLFAVIGTMVIDPKRIEVGATELPRMSPSWDLLLGSDQFARDVLAYVAYGTFGTLLMGLIAGLIGIGVGTALGFIAGYFGGWLDTIIVVLSDSFITIPGLMILIVIGAYIDQLTVEQLGLLIGGISWMGTTRVVRAQVLTLRRRAYVEVAKFNGQSDLEIVFAELIPNLAPFIAASFVGAVAGAILLSIGLSALGLGPQNEPSLGLMADYFIRFGAVPQGLWWWFGPPIVIIAIFVVGLFILITGLDQIANPRLRTSV